MMLSANRPGPPRLDGLADSEGYGGDRPVGVGGGDDHAAGHSAHGLRLKPCVPSVLQDVPHHHHVWGTFCVHIIV